MVSIFAKLKEAILVFQPFQEVLSKYSCVYQKVLEADGSTFMAL
jgi:hypothetical protein